MKNIIAITLLICFISACGQQQTDSTASSETPSSETGKSIVDSDMGLSKTSVFDTPEPQAVSYSDKFPGTSNKLPRAYPDAPPQIPHSIDNFKPITANNNACTGCHHNPSMRGKEISKGMPTPIPTSHYTDLRHKPESVSDQLVGGRYVCTQCHVPQANAGLLVENTFQSSSQP